MYGLENTELKFLTEICSLELTFIEKYGVIR